MSTTTYMPHADSIADKVCRFFARLPDEELMTREIAEKWGVETRNVGKHLAQAVKAEYLAVDGSVYSAGPTLELFKAALAQVPQDNEAPPHAKADSGETRGFHGWLERRGEASAEGRPARPPAAPTKVRSSPFWCDIKTVQIDTDVPMPARGGRTLDWTPLFDSLQIGHSFALPANAKSAVGTAMKIYKDATGKVLTCRKVDTGIRVWRLE